MMIVKILMSESIILQVTPIRIYDNRSAMYVVTLAGWKCNCCSQLQRCCAWFLADKVRFHFVFSFLFSTRNFIRKSLYHVCLLLVSKPTFAVMYNQGKPVEDACSATCSSSSYTLIIFAGPETDISTQFIYLNTHTLVKMFTNASGRSVSYILFYLLLLGLGSLWSIQVTFCCSSTCRVGWNFEVSEDLMYDCVLTWTIVNVPKIKPFKLFSTIFLLIYHVLIMLFFLFGVLPEKHTLNSATCSYVLEHQAEKWLTCHSSFSCQVWPVSETGRTSPW